MPTPRSRPQRRRDTEHRLTHDIDVWVASASADGAPYLVPLSSPRRIQAWREVNELPDRELMRDGRWLCWSDASAGRAAWPGLGGSTGRSEGEPDVLCEAGIEPGDADGDREGGPA